MRSRADTQGYFAFPRAKRATHFGRQGEQHTEWFLGAEPDRKVS
jgi:hypothetical protein